MTPELLKGLVGLALLAVFYLVIIQARRPLQPPFVAMELASSAGHAKRARQEWADAKRIRGAVWTIFFDGILVVPLYLGVAWRLAWSAIDPKDELTLGLNLIVYGFFVVAAVANWLEDFGLLLTLWRETPSAAVVLVTRLLARAKYTIFALTVVYVMFRVVVYLFGHLRTLVGNHPRSTLGWLVAATAILAFLVARRVTRLSRSHPPLLALQLASDRLSAMAVLERWGAKGRRGAQATLILESLLAVLFGLTLATICERMGVLEGWLKPEAGYLPFIKGLATSMAWLTLIAAACHLAQNIGALVAVRSNGMGWWVGPQRRVGKLRLLLLGIVALYFVVILISVEVRLIGPLGRWIAGLAPKIPLPWS